ncbi:Hypothetical protein PHPALM_21107, partial [Phytophthora palmivora]
DKRGETAQETSQEVTETSQVPEHKHAKAPKSRSSSAAKSTGKRSRSGSKERSGNKKKRSSSKDRSGSSTATASDGNSPPDVAQASTGALPAADKAQDLIQRALRPLLAKSRHAPLWRVKSHQHALLRLPLIFPVRTRCPWGFRRQPQIYPTGVFSVVVTVELSVF